MSEIRNNVLLRAITRCLDNDFLDDLISYCIDKDLNEFLFLITEKQRRNLDEEY